MKEIDEVMAVEMLSNAWTLSYIGCDALTAGVGSYKVLVDLDNDIMKSCELGEIEMEISLRVWWINNQNTWIPDKNQICWKISCSEYHWASTTYVAMSDSSEAISTVTRPHLPWLTLPTFKGDVISWKSFWDITQQFILNNNLQWLTNLTIYPVCWIASLRNQEVKDREVCEGTVTWKVDPHF